MAIGFNDKSGFVIVLDQCPDHGDWRYDTGCSAPGCNAAYFTCCPEDGCDIENGDDSRCVKALAAESEQDQAARIDRERAAFGLPSMSGEGNS